MHPQVLKGERTQSSPSRGHYIYVHNICGLALGGLKVKPKCQISKIKIKNSNQKLSLMKVGGWR
jgi:hypothetical protein